MTGLQRPKTPGHLVLASASASRASMLTNAGLTFDVDPSNVDERAIKVDLSGQNASVDAVARRLAAEKAIDVATRNPGRLIIGADQMLDCDGSWFDKPETPERAFEQLRCLRGRTHHLVTSAVVARDGEILWSHTENATMVMRELSDEFLREYVHLVGKDIVRTVGGYQLEGRGAQLFERVSGDFFVVLGLPLLPLLGFLREAGALPG